ncbi:MAG: hypothetical protein ACR2QK_02125, partial [Acidimicrobiales bacterium]
ARYGWVEIAPELDQSHRLDIGQLATAVGVAIGIAYESPANLLTGQAVRCAPRQSAAATSPTDSAGGRLVGNRSQAGDRALDHLANYELIGEGAEATLRLHPKVDGPSTGRQPTAQRTTRTAPTTALSPLRGSSRSEPPDRSKRPEPSPGSEPTAPAARPPGRRQPARASEPDWGNSVDESDPIAMFSPDTAVEQMMGKRDRRLSIDIFIGLLIVSAILLLLAYLYL